MLTVERILENDLEYGEQRSKEEIKKNRKGDFTVCVKSDTPLKVTYKMKKIDFDFGSNIFMLNQYPTKEQNEAYLRYWTKLFNTAVVPLYWEGTEPEQGYLRYDKDAPNDIFRRPPADMVVECCKKNGITMKGHPLFWHEFIAKWLPEDWDELMVLLEKRFQEISSRYAGLMPVFDAVNEPSRIWDMTYEHRTDGWKMLTPPPGYIEQVFRLAEKYFPNNELVLNDAVSASFVDYRGVYGGYYQLIDRLLKEGVRIDKVGLQCHTKTDPKFKNVFSARRLYGVLDGYGDFGKDIVISEISILSDISEELQARLTEQLYRVAFSHRNMSGIFWWNLDDNCVQTYKKRQALGENLPSGGIMHEGKPKQAYKALDRLINEEWTTRGNADTKGGEMKFNGFYGTYEITVSNGKQEKTVIADFGKKGSRKIEIEW